MLCPVCGATDSVPPLDSYDPSPRTVREAWPCCGCSATTRHRAVAGAALDSGALPPGDSLAEALFPRLRRRPRVWEMGASPMSPILAADTDYARSELRPVPGAVVQDIESTTWPGGAWDLILCSDVLEHVRLYRRGLMEIGRSLRPGGVAVVTVPDTGRDGPHEEFARIGAWRGTDRIDPAAPWHEDPLDPAGCMVYRHYSLMTLAVEAWAVARLAATITCRDDPARGVAGCPAIILRRAEP